SPPAKLGSFTVSDLLSRLSGSQLGRELIKLAFSPTCSVNTYHLEYDTVGARGEATTASAALMIPTGSHPRCQGPRPIVLYAHGKRTLKSFNIADLTSQSNEEGLALATVGPARGYIVVAPNYAGYDTSSLNYHPYLDADQQSKDMMDALTAAHSALSALRIADNHKLFVTGYSQGGHVAMATHRALQAAGIAVTASAPMSGPYAMSAFGDAVVMGRVDDGSTENFIMLASSYQHAYGNLYTTPTDILEPKYAAAIDALSTTDANTLIAQGLLPRNALFDSKPPAPEFASMTPATVLLCGGDADPSVFFLNTQLIQQYWATNTPSGRVTVLDVDSSGGPYADVKNAFRAAKDLIAFEAILHGARDGGAAAVREIYH